MRRITFLMTAFFLFSGCVAGLSKDFRIREISPGVVEYYPIITDDFGLSDINELRATTRDFLFALYRAPDQEKFVQFFAQTSPLKEISEDNLAVFF